MFARSWNTCECVFIRAYRRVSICRFVVNTFFLSAIYTRALNEWKTTQTADKPIATAGVYRVATVLQDDAFKHETL